MFVLDPHAQDPDRARSRAAVHIYSIATLSLETTDKTALNTQKCLPLFLARLNAGVSRGERR
jgi:hypothetical protein